MLKRTQILVMAFLLSFSTIGYADDTVRVILLPFQIHSSEKADYLRNEIPSLLQKQIETEGGVVLDSDLPEGTVWEETLKSSDEIRNFGVRQGADFVIWGSMTWLGQKFSFDVSLLESFTDTEVQTFFVEGTGIENLVVTLKHLSNELAIKLFRRVQIVELRVEGNQRIESDAIKRKIKTQPGAPFIARNLSEDLKTVYGMGYFDDVRVESEDVPDGKVIVFRVVEKPTIRVIRFEGNKEAIKDEDLDEALDVKTGSVLNIFKIQNNVKAIESLYKDKNYHNVKVEYEILPLENNQADVEFRIEEGEELKIESIEFEGNKAFSSRKLKKMMSTSEKGLFSFFTSSGALDRDKLEQDVHKLTAFYHNNGFVQANVGEPVLKFMEKSIHITMKVEEGPQFKVGRVDIQGDLVSPKEELMESVTIAENEFYSRDALRNDVLALTDIYSDAGYANAEVFPGLDEDEQALTVDITYRIKKNALVYFDKINITGNTKTRDKVIRRELHVYEKELFSGAKLKRSIRNLNRLDFFEDVKVETVPGKEKDTVTLNLGVTEKMTGSFSFGGGYSSYEKAFVVGSISQRNLFGRGQELELRAQIGSRTTRFNLSFTEPWLFDMPLSAGINVYNWEYQYDDYEKDSLGGSLSFGYRIWDFTRIYLTYGYDRGKLKDIEPGASLNIRRFVGTNITSSLTGTIRYDSRDKIFNPTEGSDHRLSVEYAGGLMGGDIDFLKYTAETGWYIPLVFDFVGFAHAKAGYLQETSGAVPDWERFFMGGMNSLRGFDWEEFGPQDASGAYIGGNKMIQFNFELIYPIIKKAGLAAVAFFDTGRLYDNGENYKFSGLRESAGWGIRWFSPIGPIRLEMGYILDPKENESSSGKFEFSMGSAF